VQVEIGPPQSSALQIDETRIRAAGGAGVVCADDGLVAGRQAGQIQLHDVDAGWDAFEMVLAVLVGDGIGAVFEIDTDAGDAVGGVGGRVAAVVDDYAASNEPMVSEERFSDPGRRLRLM